MNSSEFLEAMDDVHSRFILNLPPSELASSDRIFFQLEQAYWFYEDFYCSNDFDDDDDEEEQEDNNTLPRFNNLYLFAQHMFDFSPLLQPLKPKLDEMWKDFTLYKRNISTYGTILLNAECTKVALCQDWYGKSWTFPAGKVNQHETGVEAGARETYEETGFDPNCLHGLTRQMKAEAEEKSFLSLLPWNSPLREEDALVYTSENGKRRTCFVCRGVPEDFPFCPVARKEVSEVAWFPISDLPKNSFAVLPFVSQLRRWIRRNTGMKLSSSNDNDQQQRKSSSRSRPKSRSLSNDGRKRNTSKHKSKERTSSSSPAKKRTPGEKQKSKSSGSRPNSRSKPRANSNADSLGDPNERWTEQEMFSANEKILGRKIEYDGNPHTFAESILDPSHCIVVKPQPKKVTESRLQALFQRREQEEEQQTSGIIEKDFTPFFSEGGQTPWGEVVQDVLTTEEKEKAKSVPKEEDSQAFPLFQLLRNAEAPPASKAAGEQSIIGLMQTTSSKAGVNILPPSFPSESVASHDDQNVPTPISKPQDVFPSGTDATKKRKKKLVSDAKRPSNEHWDYILDWVNSMERPPPTKMFGEFKFDVDAIVHAMKVSN